MKFEHYSKTYVLEFKREFKERTERDPILETDFQVKSARPYTTVKLVELIPTPGSSKIVRFVYRTATVGCWHKEPVFSLEKGRQRALRMMCITLPKDMKPKVWTAYHGRKVKK